MGRRPGVRKLIAFIVFYVLAPTGMAVALEFVAWPAGLLAGGVGWACAYFVAKAIVRRGEER